MPRRRTKPSPSAAAGRLTPYQRRNQRARALGYRSYYDYRVHDNGRIPPDRPALSGEARQRARGHRSERDLVGAVHGGSLVMSFGGTRNRLGQWDRVDVIVVQPDGKEMTFVLRGKSLRRDRLEALLDVLESRGAAVGIFYPILKIGGSDE